ncbi:MAG TPA: hypothetical protein VGB37_16540, partial [Candidatus Lokiarchaeia archaeon]
MIELTPLETLQGVLTLTFVLISFILGFIIILRYIKYKVRQLLLVGITWIGIISPYWPDAISFVMIITTGTQLDELIYFFLANALIPLVHIIWMMAFTDFLYKKDRKIILTIISIEAIIFELFFLYFIFTDITLIGTRIAPFYVRWAAFIIVYLFYSIVLFTVTGILFARQSLKSDKKDLLLKGKFL